MVNIHTQLEDFRHSFEDYGEVLIRPSKLNWTLLKLQDILISGEYSQRAESQTTHIFTTGLKMAIIQKNDQKWKIKAKY